MWNERIHVVYDFQEYDQGSSSHQSFITDSLAVCSENATPSNKSEGDHGRLNLAGLTLGMASEEDQLLPRCKERLVGAIGRSPECDWLWQLVDDMVNLPLAEEPLEDLCCTSYR